jgi:hypothetical protein
VASPIHGSRVPRLGRRVGAGVLGRRRRYLVCLARRSPRRRYGHVPIFWPALPAVSHGSVESDVVRIPDRAAVWLRGRCRFWDALPAFPRHGHGYGVPSRFRSIPGPTRRYGDGHGYGDGDVLVRHGCAVGLWRGVWTPSSDALYRDPITPLWRGGGYVGGEPSAEPRPLPPATIPTSTSIPAAALVWCE